MINEIKFDHKCNKMPITSESRGHKGPFSYFVQRSLFKALEDSGENEEALFPSFFPRSGAPWIGYALAKEGVRTSNWRTHCQQHGFSAQAKTREGVIIERLDSLDHANLL